MPISNPSVTVNIIPASQMSDVTEQKTLIVGMMSFLGEATAGELITDFPSDGSENSLFGMRSHIAGMIRAFKRENKISRLDVMAFKNPTESTDGTGVVDFTGSTATEAGIINITVGSERYHSYNVNIAVGDTAATIGDTLVALIMADVYAPFVSANVDGVVTIEATNCIALENNLGLKVSGKVAGVDVALTAFSGGSPVPTITNIYTATAAIRYQTIVWPSSWSLTDIADELDSKFNVTNNVMDGVVLQVKADTVENLKSYVAPFNSPSVVVLGQKWISVADNRIGPQTFEIPDNMAAQIAAIRALRLTSDANLTRYLTTVAGRDQFGGMAIGSLPYFNTALPNASVGVPLDDFTPEELVELSNNGVSTYGPNRAYNGTIMGEMVTTYLTDIAANPDESYKFLNTVDTASLIREFYYVNLKRRYAQTRLTNGDLLPGRDMANASSIRAFCNQLYDELADEALVQKGTAAKKDYNDNLSIEIDISEGKVTINQSPLLVSQIRIVIGTLQINLGSD